ncbi:nicotinamide riboside transporter PnuC [Bacteroidaceae bacterium]|jgi:nicotinamide mononucleotide transporter
MNYLEIAGAFIGLLYLWFEYKASIWLWPVSVIMPAIYIIVYYQAGLYADSGISVYYLLAGVYGWWVWLKRTSGKVEKPITFTPSGLVLPLLIIFCVVFVCIGKVLELYTDSTVPWWDSFTTALSIIGMWMLAHKYVEQWLVWLVVDVVSCALYVYKDLYYTSCLYGLYAVIAFFGYLKWKQLMRMSDETI